jgi:hypothetical protein
MQIIDVNRDKARSWVERWLRAGHAVSNAVLATDPFGVGRFRTCVSDGIAPEQLSKFEAGNMASTKEANTWLARTFEELNREGAACVVVEHDLASRTDPFIGRGDDSWAFVGDRVLAWSDLQRGGEVAAVEEVQGVGSGYPRNMFVSTHSAEHLGLADRQQVPEQFPAQVAESLRAVVVSIFDDESYLVWDRVKES